MSGLWEGVHEQVSGIGCLPIRMIGNAKGGCGSLLLFYSLSSGFPTDWARRLSRSEPVPGSLNHTSFTILTPDAFLNAFIHVSAVQGNPRILTLSAIQGYNLKA